MTEPQDITMGGQSQVPRSDDVDIQCLVSIKAEVEKLHERICGLPQLVVDLLGSQPTSTTIGHDMGTRGRLGVASLVQVELGAANEQNVQLAEALDRTQAELQDARRRIEVIQGKETKLRAIILQKTGAEKVSDQDVKDRFVLIRQKAQAIANSSAYQVAITPKTSKSMTDEAWEFYRKTWSLLTSKDRKNHVMAKIFKLLYDSILGVKLFSPSIIGYEDKQGIEPDLRRFETFLEKNNVDADLLADWRIATMDCISQLPDATHRSKRPAEEIFSFFSPIITEEISPHREDELRSQIADLCSEALALRMIMRRSKEGYRCEFPPTQERPCTVQHYENLVEPLSVEGGKNNQGSDEIAYTVFGGLVKQADPIANPKILEKAQVIMKRR